MTAGMQTVPFDAREFGKYRGVRLFKWSVPWLDGPQYYFEQYGLMQMAFNLKQAIFFIDLTIGGHDGL
jgi:hypothetical protein